MSIPNPPASLPEPIRIGTSMKSLIESSASSREGTGNRCPACNGPMRMSADRGEYCGAKECMTMAARVRQKGDLESYGRIRLEQFRNSLPARYRFADQSNEGGPVLPVDEQDILLLGANGRGKTFSAAFYALHQAKCGVRCEWQEVPILLARFRSTFRDGSKESEMDLINKMVEPSLLVLDDFGAEKATDYTMQSLYCILSRRVNEFRATVVTTNLSPSEIRSAEPRIASRLMSFRMIALDGPDRRIKA